MSLSATSLGVVISVPAATRFVLNLPMGALADRPTVGRWPLMARPCTTPALPPACTAPCAAPLLCARGAGRRGQRGGGAGCLARPRPQGTRQP